MMIDTDFEFHCFHHIFTSGRVHSCDPLAPYTRVKSTSCLPAHRKMLCGPQKLSDTNRDMAGWLVIYAYIRITNACSVQLRRRKSNALPVKDGNASTSHRRRSMQVPASDYCYFTFIFCFSSVYSAYTSY